MSLRSEGSPPGLIAWRAVICPLHDFRRVFTSSEAVFDTVEGIQDDRGNTYLYRTLLDEQGQAVVERVIQTEEVVGRARRIRYTRH